MEPKKQRRPGTMLSRPSPIAFLALFWYARALVPAFLLHRSQKRGINNQIYLSSRLNLPTTFEAKVKVEMLSSSSAHFIAINGESAEDDEESASEAAQSLMELASRHFASQALHGFVAMGIPEILGDARMSVNQISDLLDESNKRKVNRDGLLRIMRLMVVEGVLIQSKAPISDNSSPSRREEQEVSFGLSTKGKLLRSGGRRNLASVVLHWMERPLWNAWAELPGYIAGDCMVGRGTEEGDNVQSVARAVLPFEKANGMSSDDFYCQENAESLKNANEFVRYISNEEERAVLSGFNWAELSGKTLLDVGGHRGKIMSLIASKYPEINCRCFDLPEVISSAAAPEKVELFGGDIFTGDLPSCDVIFMKHFLDKIMWDEKETILILSSCRDALPDDGQIIIAEAVLPDDCSSASGTNRLHLYVDVLFLLVGREAARTESEWNSLAEKAGLRVDWITATSAPSCYIIVLSKT